MKKIREMIRLHKECGLSNRQIAIALNVSRPVVSQYLTNFKFTGLRYMDLMAIDDDKLVEIFERKKKEESEKYRILSEKFDYFLKELKRPGITLELLWREYNKENPEGYSYSRFCYHFQVWRNSSCLTMHIDHKAGEKMFVDYTGHKLKVYDKKTNSLKGG